MRLAVLALLLIFGCQAEQRQEEIHVFAAASLTDVMEALADSFETRQNDAYRVSLNIAGSSLLARQISQGAQADVFVSAHPDWTEYLREKGRLGSIDTLPITNDLVMVARSKLDAIEGRLALADPEHVPAGIYAREALQCEGMWRELEDQIVPTLDVRAALTAVSEGAAEAAIVYASDALLAPELELHDILSRTCQPRVLYTAGTTPTETEGGRRFLQFLGDPSQQSTWRQYGFANEPVNHVKADPQPDSIEGPNEPNELD